MALFILVLTCTIYLSSENATTSKSSCEFSVHFRDMSSRSHQGCSLSRLSENYRRASNAKGLRSMSRTWSRVNESIFRCT